MLASCMLIAESSISVGLFFLSIPQAHYGCKDFPRSLKAGMYPALHEITDSFVWDFMRLNGLQVCVGLWWLI